MPTYAGSLKKQRNSKKTSTSASLTMLKPLAVWITTNYGKRTGSKLRKEYVKAVYCHPAYLTSIQSTSCEMPGRMKHKLESSLPGEISITSDADDTTLMAESEELKNLLMKVKEEGLKADLKFNILKTKVMASSPITAQQIDGGTEMETVTDYFRGLQNHCW